MSSMFIPGPAVAYEYLYAPLLVQGDATMPACFIGGGFGQRYAQIMRLESD